MTTAAIDCYITTISRAISPITAPVSKLGGEPVFTARLEAPHCRHCGQQMDFIGQFRLDSPVQLSLRYQMAYVFMCPNQPDERGWLTCPTWEALSGASAVLLQQDDGLALLPDVPARYPDYELTFQRVPEPDIDVNRLDLPEDERQQVSEATKFGGVPAWLQANETPRCLYCDSFMRFVAQIDAAINGSLPSDPAQWKQYHFFDFGAAGIAYVFICPNDCSPTGAFLWQTT